MSNTTAGLMSSAQAGPATGIDSRAASAAAPSAKPSVYFTASLLCLVLVDLIVANFSSVAFPASAEAVDQVLGFLAPGILLGTHGRQADQRVEALEIEHPVELGRGRAIAQQGAVEVAQRMGDGVARRDGPGHGREAHLLQGLGWQHRRLAALDIVGQTGPGDLRADPAQLL